MQSSDRTHASRHRLSRLTAQSAAELEPTAAGEPLPPARGWRERWLPARWHGARLDPGKHGALALAAVAAAAAIVAATGVWRDRPVAQAVPSLPAMSLAPLAGAPAGGGPPSSTVAAPTTLVISVAGKVHTPGLVTVPSGARVADALAAAGGAVPGTDLLTLNLAQPVSDGQQIVVGVAPGTTSISGGPANAAAAPESATGNGAGGKGVSGRGAGSKVNLNSASATELEALPGVGPVMAKAIIDHRTKSGPFRSVDQLSDVSGIGPARLAQLRDLVTV
ncbi:MAG: ComEA family DNA-binding protein [Mycobacteriaceae bacterium]